MAGDGHYGMEVEMKKKKIFAGTILTLATPALLALIAYIAAYNEPDLTFLQAVLVTLLVMVVIVVALTLIVAIVWALTQFLD
jgi:hypothetical protein